MTDFFDAKPALHVKGLSLSFGGLHVLSDVDLDVRDREFLAIIGANGAGKTTMLHAIVGLVKPCGGTVAFEGLDIAGRAPAAVVQMGISLVPEHRHLFPEMTVEENPILGAYTRGARRPRSNFCVVPGTPRATAQPAAMLSGGQQQMLAVGRGLMAQPRLLLLDEPSLGLAPQLVDRVLGTLKEINRLGTTILLVEQNAIRTLPLSEMTHVLENGSIVLHGASHDRS